jgi:hypothetical protein
VGPLQDAGADRLTGLEDQWRLAAVEQVGGGRQSDGTGPDNGDGQTRGARGLWVYYRLVSEQLRVLRDALAAPNSLPSS